jgi:hypothetical protein
MSRCFRSGGQDARIGKCDGEQVNRPGRHGAVREERQRGRIEAA